MNIDPDQRSSSPSNPVYKIDGQELKRLTEAGLIWLKTNQQIVNSLNVFPVPDGDTGTNMVLTMQSAFDEVAESPEKNAGKMAAEIAQGALMGARGNSGVILSQIWRGFARAVDKAASIDGPRIVEAFQAARDTAYKGVVRPVEGTMLTVIKDIAQATFDAQSETNDLLTLLNVTVESANNSVQRTPELLPVLKEAGVVDSGGKGLFYIFEGMLRYINKQPLDKPLAQVRPLSAIELENSIEAIEPGQDFEIVLDFHPYQPLNVEEFYDSLDNMGTSIQIGEGDGIYRLHIHVPDSSLFEPITYAKSLGTVTKVAIENLVAQMEEIDGQRSHQLNLAPIEPGQIGVVAVAPGPGIARVFASLGVGSIVEGGQTMNPSTQELLNSFEHLPTDKIIILPNNKNILLAAQSTVDLTVKKVAVIPSKTVPQGLAAMLRLAPDGDFSEVVAQMTDAIDEVDTGEITTATRTVEIDGIKVNEGQIIVLFNGKLVAAIDDLLSACLELLDIASAEEYELITMFYGETVSKKQVSHIVDILRENYPEQEFEIQEGGQPHYHFIIGIE